jgi:hypothetical protein
MKMICSSLLLFLGTPFLTGSLQAQLDLFSPQQRVEFTPEWHGERFPDGRPNVPDSVLVTVDEAWDVLQDAQFLNQFEGGWKVLNPVSAWLAGSSPRC